MEENLHIEMQQDPNAHELTSSELVYALFGVPYKDFIKNAACGEYGDIFVDRKQATK